MSLKTFLSIVGVCTALAWFSWYEVLQNIDPFANPELAFLFYVTLALALIGTLTTAGLIARRLVVKDEDSLLRHFKQSARQAIFLTIAFLIVLILGSKGLFVWWIGLGLLALVVMIEAIAYSNRTAKSGYVQ